MPHFQLHHLALTLPATTTETTLPRLMQELFGIDGIDPADIRLPRGRHGYREAYRLTGEHGAELINILLDGVAGNLKGTTHIVVHGAALEMGVIDVDQLCREIIGRRGWITRVDLAADDRAGLLPWPEIVEASGPDQWENRITTTTCRHRLNRKTGEREPNPPVYLRSDGETVYFGKASSDLSVCLYTRRGPVRVEIRIQNRAAATEIVRRIAAGEGVGTLTARVLRRNLIFHVPGFRRKDRRKVSPWWQAFLGSAEAIKLPRQRGDTHRNPWHIPLTRAGKACKAVQRHLAGASMEQTAEILEVLRAIISEQDTEAEIARRFAA